MGWWLGFPLGCWPQHPPTPRRGSLQGRALAASLDPACEGGTVPAHGHARTLGMDGLSCLAAGHPGRWICQHLCPGHLATVFPIAWNLLAGSAKHRAGSCTRLEERQLPSFTPGMPLRKKRPLLRPRRPCCHRSRGGADVSCPACARPCHPPLGQAPSGDRQRGSPCGDSAAAITASRVPGGVGGR